MLHGNLNYHKIEGNSLKGNPLGDQTLRECAVYIPPEYDPNKTYPLLVDLAPYTSSGLARVGWKNFSKSVPEMIDEMIVAGEMHPAIVVFPDTFTKLGGNQHINAPAIGNYADYIHQDVVPYVEATYNCGGKGMRGVYGYSSGGYAALVYGMNYSNFWDAVACQSGDLEFDLAYLPDMGSVCAYFASFDYDATAFIKHFWESGNPNGNDIHLLMMLAMAASYDPQSCDIDHRKDRFNIKLPVDTHTLELDHESWGRWLKHDPLRMVDDHHQALASLKALYIDCGNKDQYRLQYGARRFVQKLKALKTPHTYEEFDGSHLGISYRVKHSLPLITKALLR